MAGPTSSAEFPVFRLRAGLLALLLVGSGHAAVRAADCEGLKNLSLPHVTISLAQPITDGTYFEDMAVERPGRTYKGLPAFCRVRGVSTPVPGSEIGFEIWLPQKDWTGRLHMIGNGAYVSNIAIPQMVARLKAGEVAVGTDTGHKGSELTFAIGHPETIADFSYRAVHESVIAAKEITKAYYTAAPHHSYFSGCSTGGYQALTEAQRFPDDFDGIIAGAPGNNRSNLTLAFLWQFLANHRQGDNSAQIVPNAKLAMVNRAVVAACDRLDGVADGVINDPRACHFNLASLQCTAGDGPNCLTEEQIGAMRKIYAGPKDVRTGKALYPSYTFGAEGAVASEEEKYPGWSGFWSNPKIPTEPARADYFRYWVFNDSHWDWWKFNWGSDLDIVRDRVGKITDSTDADLSRFTAHHGKLIMFIGWQDPVGAAGEASNYYQDVEDHMPGKTKAVREKATQDFLRFYMVSGMVHCAGGPGATNFSTATRDSTPPVGDAKHDMTLALEDWVEKGAAPDSLIATHYDKNEGPDRKVAFQRPVCVYPKVAHYKGGPTASADSFACVEDKTTSR